MVPTEVMLGCEGLETDWAKPTVPTRLLAFRFEIAEPFEATRRPCTLRPVSVPIEVMLGWEGLVTERAVPTVPEMFAEFRFEIPKPFPK